MGRLDKGGRIDRSRPLAFTFDGRPFTGYAGDTLASALLANDVAVVGRSFKYHRPRGIVGAGEEEPNALMQLEPGTPWSEPNVKATRIELYDGLTAESVNRWPSLAFDVGATVEFFHRFVPAAFYYKTFLWPSWKLFEPGIRKAAGLGVAPDGPDPERYLKRNAHCDVLVVGAGPAGLAAARAAVRAGKRVILAESEAILGGSLLSDPRAEIDGRRAAEWTEAVEAELRAAPDTTLLTRTTVTGYYDHNLLVAVEKIADHLPPSERGGAPRQRIWHIRAGKVVLATGSHERPLVFPDNDRPGILLASTARTYLGRFAVTPGRRIVLFTNNDAAYRAAFDLASARVEVAAIVDVRARPGPAAVMAKDYGIRVVPGAMITGVRGRTRVTAVRIAPRNGGPDGWVDVDALLMSGGATPAVHLFSQSGGRLAYDEARTAFVPSVSAQKERSVGAANGTSSLAAALAEGHAAGGGKPADAPVAAPAPAEGAIEPFWRTPVKGARQWVDFQSDATEKDVGIAERENFVSVEHLKRYTTIGMSTDQGKTSNVNALAIMGELTGRAPGEVGTTRFRAPYAPIPMSAVAAGARDDLFAPRRLSPIDRWHRENGAVMEDYGAWARPAVYPRPGESRETAILREHRLVREGVGLFDSSPIGKIEVTGKDAARFLDFIIANNVASIPVGRARYHLMLTEHGVVFDDGVTVRLAEDHFLVSPSSGAAARVAAMLEEWRQCEFPELDLRIADVTSAWAAVAVAGPRSRELVEALGTGVDLSAEACPHLAARTGAIGGAPVRILRVSFSGERQYELQVPASCGLALWRALLQAGAAARVAPVGVEAWLRLRIEKGYIHVGSDTDGNTLPDDIGYGAPLAKKAGDFVGRRSLARDDAIRPDREQLVGLEADGASPLTVGSVLFVGTAVEGFTEKHGRVTSSAPSPSLGRGVALALLKRGRARLGETISVYDQGTIRKATVVSPVFYDPEGEKLRG